MKGSEAAKTAARIAAVFLLLYVFLVSISLMGGAFKLFGKDFAEGLFALASNKFIGLFVGILTTALVQSSSFTTSVVVGLVGGGVLDIGLAIPIIMGANIGTSVTNTLVAHGHVTRKDEFRRAVESGLVHDMFNLLAVSVLFPLELMFGMIEKTARIATDWFGEMGGVTFSSPLKAAVEPASKFIIHFVEGFESVPVPIQATIVFLVSLMFLFGALYFIVRVLKSLVLARVESFFSTYIFRNAALAMVVGMMMTTLVQSSSVTTSLIVPMAAAGILTLEMVFPFTLGANLGTTVTAILASLATVSIGNMGGVTIAFAHLIFNIFGIAIFYPLRFIPIGMAREVGRRTLENRFFPMMYVILVFFYIPGIFVCISRYGMSKFTVLLLVGLVVLLGLFKIIANLARKKAA